MRRKKENPIKGILKLSFVKFLIWILNILPRGLLYCLARTLTFISWLILRPARNTVLFNLDRVFGKEKSRREIKRLARENAFHLVKNVCELFRGMNLSEDQIDRFFKIEGRENLDSALAKGKGVIALSAHLGNFMMISAKMNREGYSFGYIVRDILGNKTSRRVGSFTTTLYTYDALNRLKTIDYPGATPDVSYIYDKNSNIEQISNANSVRVYVRDENDNITQENIKLPG